MLLKYLKYQYLVLCIFTSGILAKAQNVSIQGKLQRSEIKTGEHVAVDLIIRTDNLPQTKFYIQEDTSNKDAYTVLEFGAIDTIDIDGRIKEITAVLLLTSFDSTLVSIPPIVVETPTDRAETQPLALKVVQPEVDANHPESFKDIKAPWHVALGIKDWLLYLLSSWIFWLVILLPLSIYLGYLLRKRLKMDNSEPLQPETAESLNIWQRTQRALDVLESEKLWEQGAFKEYYTRLIEIFKVYLDESFAWSTMEMTSSELKEKLHQAKLQLENHLLIDDLLRDADLSKFAKATPEQEKAVQALNKMRSLLTSLETQINLQNEENPQEHPDLKSEL